MFQSEFFSEWEARNGAECAMALLIDSHNGNVGEARRILDKVRMFAERHQAFTAGDLYRDKELNLYDIPMYLALGAMVEAGELIGPNPYAHEPKGTHDELVYVLSPRERWFLRMDAAISEPCAGCTLDCDGSSHCPF